MPIFADKGISKLIIDAFDMDIQMFSSQAISNLHESPVGYQFADWAKKNPKKFEALLRSLSVFIRQLPKNNKFLPEIIFEQLTRLPLELRRGIKPDGYEQQKLYLEENVKSLFSEKNMKSLFNDEKFTGEYATALEGLSADQLRSIASLKKKHLIEWVSTPSQLRPYKLEKLIEKSKSQIFLDKTKDNLTSTIEKGKNDFKRGAIQGLKWFWGFALILFVLFAILIRIYG